MQITFGCVRRGDGLRRRLLDEDVEPGAADLAGLEGLEQRRLVDDPAARGVDDDQTPFLASWRTSRRRSPVVSFVLGTCTVTTSARSKQLVERDQLDVELRGGLGA